MGPYSSQPFPALLVLQILQEAGDSSLHQLLKAFVSAGRVDHVAMVMGLHPQYLSSFWKTQYLLLRMDGPLPYHKRHYIAIMVSRGPWGHRVLCVLPALLLGGHLGPRRGALL